MSVKKIRIGTRSSQLALWQANLVKNQLEGKNIPCELVLIKSSGDLDLDKPIHEMLEIGVFTKALDQGLLNNEIDIAVHSMKDVPTSLAAGLVQVAVLKRGTESDILLYKQGFDFNQAMTIATGSLRRKAQWLAQYPQHRVVNLRGNVQKRLENFQQRDWQGAIFAKVGLERINHLPRNCIQLDWMIPAPAQGAVVVLARQEDEHIISQVQCLNDKNSAFCTSQERAFLRTLEGGCSAPIGAVMKIQQALVSFKAGLFSLDGCKKVVLDVTIPLEQAHFIGRDLAEEVLNKGGEEIMQEIRKVG